MEDVTAFEKYFYAIAGIFLLFWCLIDFFKNFRKWNNRQVVTAEITGYRYKKSGWVSYDTVDFTPVITVNNKEIPEKSAKKLIRMAPEQTLKIYKALNDETVFFNKDFFWTGLITNLATIIMILSAGACVVFFNMLPDGEYPMSNESEKLLNFIGILALTAFIFMLVPFIINLLVENSGYKKAPKKLKSPEPLSDEELERINKNEIISFELARRYMHFKDKKNEWWQIILALMFLGFICYFMIYQKMLELGYL